MKLSPKDIRAKTGHPYELLKYLLLVWFFITCHSSVFADEVPVAVKLQVLSEQNNQLERQFFGQVVAPKTVELAFQVGGEIKQLSIIEGARVSQGEVLATLDLEPFELQVKRMELELDRSERQLQRLTSLGSERVAQSDIDNLRTSVALARVAIKQARRDLHHGTLQAPFDGVVANRLVEKFSTIKSGTPVVRLHDLSELLVEIDVPEIIFRRFDATDQVEFYALLPGSEERFSLQLREYKAETSSVGQTYSITLAMQVPDSMNLLPGASVTVVVRPGDRDKKIYISPHAIVFDPQGNSSLYVYHVTESGSGRVERRPVTLNVEGDGRFSLLSGVEAGSEIVVAGAAKLTDGQMVRRFSGFRD